MFQPGQSGNPSGRRKRFLRPPDLVLKEKGIDPVEEVLKLMPELKAADQLRAWLELLEFCHPKPKEVPVDPNEVERMTDAELIKVLREKVPELTAA